MSLSQHGLVLKSTGECIASKTEQDIFDALRVKWIPPHERNSTSLENI